MKRWPRWMNELKSMRPSWKDTLQIWPLRWIKISSRLLIIYCKNLKNKQNASCLLLNLSRWGKGIQPLCNFTEKQMNTSADGKKNPTWRHKMVSGIAKYVRFVVNGPKTCKTTDYPLCNSGTFFFPLSVTLMYIRSAHYCLTTASMSGVLFAPQLTEARID